MYDFGNVRYGYYEYKNTAYIKRSDVLDKMLEMKDYSGSFIFRFNDEFFSKLNWMEEPDIDVLTLYKLRAQQLREKYDYLVLFFSGGSDSVQILNTFMDNNIFIDEVQCYHHEEGLQAIERSHDLNSIETIDLLEYRYSSKKYLDILKNKSPNTKIVEVDLTKMTMDLIAGKKYTHMGLDKKSILMTNNIYNTFPKLYSYAMFDYNDKRTFPVGRDRIAFIRGVEKPKISFDYDRFLYFHFNDTALLYARNIMQNELPNIGILENFFWSIDAPLIPIKQSHMILNHFKSKPALLRAYREYRRNAKEDGISWYNSNLTFTERLIANIIYPEWLASKPYMGMKGGKTSDFLILDHLNIKHHGESATKEYRDFMLKKYDKIRNKKLLSQFMGSEKYRIGKL